MDQKYLNYFEGNKTKGGCLITYLICIVICIYSCKVYLCFLLHFLQNSMQRIWPCFSILGLQKFLESAIGQSMVVKIEHFFAAKMQLKCNRCPEASIDRPLTEVSTCYMCSWYLLPTQLKAFWWNCSLFSRGEAKGAKISAPWSLNFYLTSK